MKLTDSWLVRKFFLNEEMDRDLFDLYGGLAAEVGFGSAFLIKTGINVSFLSLYMDIIVPKLPEHASSLWEFGHWWHHGMIYCDDLALAQQLGDRYGVDVSGSFFLGVLEFGHE